MDFNSLNMTDRWETRFNRIRLFGWLALAGVPFIAAAAFTSGFMRVSGGVAALLLIAPGLVYIYVIVILHWKDRYRGKHSDLWGVLILVETSGWMKLVYIFRHIIPDMRHTGRYHVIFGPVASEQYSDGIGFPQAPPAAGASLPLPDQK